MSIPVAHRSHSAIKFAKRLRISVAASAPVVLCSSAVRPGAASPRPAASQAARSSSPLARVRIVRDDDELLVRASAALKSQGQKSGPVGDPVVSRNSSVSPGPSASPSTRVHSHGGPRLQSSVRLSRSCGLLRKVSFESAVCSCSWGGGQTEKKRPKPRVRNRPTTQEFPLANRSVMNNAARCSTTLCAPPAAGIAS